MMQVDVQHPKSTQSEHAEYDAVGNLQRMAHGFRLGLSFVVGVLA